MNKKLLAFVVLLVTAHSACPAVQSLPGLQSASVTFTTNATVQNTTTSTYSYQFSTQFSSLPSVALTIQGFSLNKGSLTQWVIQTSDIKVSQVTVQFKYLASQWVYAKVGIFAAARSDVILGASTAQLGSLKNSTQSFKAQVSTLIPSPQTSIARTFISGYTSLQKQGDAEIYVRTYDISIQQNYLQIGIQVAGLLEISSARVNYIIFSPTTSNFASYGGAVTEKAFAGDKLYNLQKGIYSSPYSFYGFANIIQSLGSATTITSQISQDFYLRIHSSSSFQEFLLSYIVIGVAPAQVCSQCPNSFIIPGSCGDQCPTNTYSITYSNVTRACRACPSEYNFVVNAEKNGCVCANGYALANGICLGSSGNSSNLANVGVTSAIVSGASLTVGSGTVNTINTANTANTGNSAVPSSTISVYGQQISTGNSAPVISSTTTGSIGNSGSSGNNVNILPVQSPSTGGQSYVPNVEVPSNSNSYIPTTTQSLPYTPTTTPTSTVSPVIQTAGQSYNPSTGSSLPTASTQCPANTYWTGYRCACKVGYIEQSSVCVLSSLPANNKNIFRPAEFIYKISILYQPNATANCKNNEVFNGQTCVCISGWVRDQSNNCVSQAQCPENSNLINGQCVCINGYQMQNNRCVAQSQCTDPNSTPGPNNQCVCKTGYVQQNNICVIQCPQGQTYNQSRCVPQCDDRYERLNNSNVCQCRQGYGRLNGNCVTCPNGSYLQNGVCITCPVYSQFDSVTKRCVCSSGRTLVNNVCVETSCTRQNEVYSSTQGQCVCVSGTTRINGVCTTCQGTINPITQTCNPSNVCGDGARSSSQQCDDGNTRSGDGCSSTCIVQNGYTCVGSPSTCTYTPTNVCGNGVRSSNQQCDDGNTRSGDGCSSACTVESGYTCVGSPSVCTYTPANVCGDGVRSSSQQCDDGNTRSGDGCSTTCIIESGYTCVGSPSVCTYTPPAGGNLTLIDKVIFNYNNMYIILETPKAYDLPEAQKNRFIKYDFPDQGTSPTSVYCPQDGNNKARFNCLCVYNSGLPNKVFNVNFSYSYLGDTGSLVVRADPLSSTFRTRSLS